MVKQGFKFGILLSLMVSTAWAAEHGEGEAGLFSGSYGEAIWTVIAFVALFLVLRKFAWNALLEGLQKRELHIKTEIETAESARRKAETMLGQSESQGQAIRKAATEDAQKRSHQIIDQARQEVKLTKQQALSEIEHLRGAAVDRVREQAVDLVTLLTSEVIGRHVTTEDNERLIREALSRLGQQARGASA